jgi:hypothetical protein
MDLNLNPDGIQIGSLDPDKARANTGNEENPFFEAM